MRVIAAAHDPGGANAVAVTVASLRSQGDSVLAWGKGPALRQFAALGVACTPLPEGPGANAVLSDSLRAANLLLTGTSAQDGFEQELTLNARERGIPSLALIDYDANHALRFRKRRAPGAPVYPDVVTALDQTCAQALAEAGVPAAAIRVTGQPYYAWLAWLATRPRPPRSLGQSGRRVLFASQPDADEPRALEIVLAAFAEHRDRDRLTIRFHPRQPTEEQDRCLARFTQHGLPPRVDQEPSSLVSVAAHDLVLGITSTILVEAALLGIPTGSVLVAVTDTLATNRSGLTAALHSVDDVRRFLAGGRSEASEEAFVASQRGALESVTALCRQLAVQPAR
jgi:hypothetical protein